MHISCQSLHHFAKIFIMSEIHKHDKRECIYDNVCVASSQFLCFNHHLCGA